jgi:hypothetical protein
MRLTLPLDTSGALLEGLHCLTASCPLPNHSRFPGDDRGNVFFGEITGGAQLESGAPLEFEPKQELTRGVWNALPEDLEA